MRRIGGQSADRLRRRRWRRGWWGAVPDNDDDERAARRHSDPNERYREVQRGNAFGDYRPGGGRWSSGEGSSLGGLATFLYPPSPIVGIHTLDAHYSGDANHLASDSGQQTAVVTGSTTIEVSGTSGTIAAPVTLPITLN